MTRWWLAVASADQWRTAFGQGNIWGLKPNGRPGLMWELISDKDQILFYATLPISGVIGFGTIRRKFKQDRPLWPEEIREKKVLWPLRFEFDVNFVIPFNQWDSKTVAGRELKSLARAGFQTIEESLANQIVREFTEESMSNMNQTGPEQSLRVDPQIPQLISVHNKLRDQIKELGELQKFIAQTEYKMENERLDVVWRRVAQSVPTYVFEVQIGGDLYHAIGKLKHAYDIWNSRIFLVGQDRDKKVIDALLAGTFHEIKSKLIFIEVSRFRELYEIKHRWRMIEDSLGLL